MLGRRDRTKGLEAEVQNLEVRRSAVLNRLTDAAARHEAAIAEQRRFLTETDGADARLAKAVAEACRKAADDRAALEDAARTLAGLIEDTKARLAAERDRRERDRTAGEIEAGAAAIEAAAAELDRAATAFDSARGHLIAVCRESAPHDPVLGHGPDGGFVTAAGRLAGILSRESPFPGVPGYEHPIGAVPAAAVTVSAMRANATAIRQGSAPSVLPAKPLAIPTAAVFPMVRMALWRPAFYRSHLGHRVDLCPSNCEAPEPIAQNAFAAGAAFPVSSAAGQRVMALLKHDPGARIEAEDGNPRAVKATGIMGDGGRGMAPAPPPIDLGMLPDCFGVMLPEAAQ